MKHLRLFEFFDIKFDKEQDAKMRSMSIDALSGKAPEIVMYLKGKPSTEELHKDLKSLDIDFEGINASKKSAHYTVGDVPSEFNLYANGPSIEVLKATTYVPSDKIIDKLESTGWKVVFTKRDGSSFTGAYSVMYMQKGEYMLYTIVSDKDEYTSINTISKIVKE